MSSKLLPNVLCLLLISASPGLVAADTTSPTLSSLSSATTTTPEHVHHDGDASTTASETMADAQPTTRTRVTTVPVLLSQLTAPQASAQGKARSRARRESRMLDAFTTAPTLENDNVWESALYATTVIFPQTQFMRDGIRKALRAHESLPIEFQRSALEAAYGIHPHAFLVEMSSISEITTSPKLFAMASLYLARGLPAESGIRHDIIKRMTARFPAWEEDPILTMLHHDMGCIADSATTATIGLPDHCKPPLPPLRTIFSSAFAPGWTVVYTLQRPNRDYPGMALVRRPDGKFHRNADGTLFHISHLARSRTNLPGYITNGNTPQGVFTIDGLSRTRNLGIGQTPFLLTMLPHEADPATYFHDEARANTSWTLEMYLNILPAAPKPGLPSWRDYFPMRVAWYAGAAGRNEMLSHGTAMDPAPYEGASWFPSTPTSGCICAKELWDDEGKPLLSDQLALAHAWLEASGIEVPRHAGEGVITLEGGGPDGFFALIEIADKQQPVTLDEVVTEILAAESGSSF